MIVLLIEILLGMVMKNAAVHESLGIARFARCGRSVSGVTKVLHQSGNPENTRKILRGCFRNRPIKP
jgi:hypothetical protein